MKFNRFDKKKKKTPLCARLSLLKLLFESLWYPLRPLRWCFQGSDSQLALGDVSPSLAFPLSYLLFFPSHSLTIFHWEPVDNMYQLHSLPFHSLSSTLSECLHARHMAPRAFLSLSSLSHFCYCPNFVSLISNITECNVLSLLDCNLTPTFPSVWVTRQVTTKHMSTFHRVPTEIDVSTSRFPTNRTVIESDDERKTLRRRSGMGCWRQPSTGFTNNHKIVSSGNAEEHTRHEKMFELGNKDIWTRLGKKNAPWHSGARV